MRRILCGLATAAIATSLFPVAASAAPPADGTGRSASDVATTRAQIARANSLPVVRDRKAGWTRSTAASGTSAVTNSSYGSYSYRKGVILATSDAFKGLIPTGHAAIGYSSSQVVESVSSGVVRGANDWFRSKSQAYQTSVRSTTAAQDAAAADWADGQRGKPYNWNYLDRDTRKRFYCSQLVWAAFKDKYGIDLDTSAYLWAVHPMELVNTSAVYLIYRKK
ncbi:MAG: YiiX/YebB-like N1pC/P60 family cysteine hydrolase [Micropruina sp.]|uniref:YiiX/YebB-like N1pC/P60 family cysteine hydrolase n=1 Tax=Micropruina sp. TaxID=2737536 RepID=UPI0039E4918E